MNAVRSPAPAVPPWPWRVVAIVVLVAIACTGWMLSQALDARHVFDYYNVLFDTDPNVRVWVFSSGWGDFSLVHPWGWLPSLPIRAYALASVALSPTPSAIALRREVGLALSPTCAAVSSGLVLGIAWRAGLTPGRALLAMLLFSLFFAQALFGGVPDYPVVAGVTVTAVLSLLAWESAERRLAPQWVWLIAVLASAAVTATNAIPAVAAFAVSRRAARWSWKAVSLHVLGACIAVAVVSVVGVVLGRALYHPGHVNVSAVVARYSDLPTAFTFLARFPVALSSSVLPGSLAVVGNELARRSGGPDISFSLEPDGWQALLAPGVWVVLLIVVLSVRAALRVRGSWSPVILGALLVVAHNWLLHAFYGRELMLYAANWTPALAVLVVSLLRSRRFQGRATDAVVLVAAVASVGYVTWHRVLFILQQFDRLATQ